MTAQQAGVLLLDLAVILVIARVMGAAARRLGQPAVVGEIAAGIALGPTVLGATAGRVVFPVSIRPALTAVADVGLALFMFIVGLELDRDSIGRNLKTATSVCVGSTVLPFCTGIALAYLLTRHDPSHHRLAFVVFFGAAMSITSFPVLARILMDLALHRAPLGALALSSAAANNVIAWAMLAVAIAMGGGGGRVLWLVALVPVYVATLFGVIRPLLRRLAAARPAPGELLPVLVAGLMVSGVITGWLGLHFIFGTFLFGVIVPAEGTDQLRSDIREQIGKLCMLLLLPVFFVVAGLQVDLTHIGLAGFGELALILLVAITGKYAGAFGAARLLGTDVRQSAALATLMNTRGLTELIVLAIGLQLGFLDTELYSYLVVMTLVTTAMVGPLMRRVYPRRFTERDKAAVKIRADDEMVLTANSPRELPVHAGACDGGKGCWS